MAKMQIIEKFKQDFAKLRRNKKPNSRFSSEESAILATAIADFHRLDPTIGARPVAELLGTTHKTILRMKHELGLAHTKKAEVSQLNVYILPNDEADELIRAENRYFSIHIMGSKPEAFIDPSEPQANHLVMAEAV